MTSRRGFLASLAGAAAIALDPERALWVPGAKLISVPAARVLAPGEIFTMKIRYLPRIEFETMFPAPSPDNRLRISLPRPPRFRAQK